MEDNNTLDYVKFLIDWISDIEDVDNTIKKEYLELENRIKEDYKEKSADLDYNFHKKSETNYEKMRKNLIEIEKVLNKIYSLDSRLAKRDIYYRKTRDNYKDESDVPIDKKYEEIIDYNEIVSNLSKEFSIISSKYDRQIKNQFLNKVNYIISPSRKQDYRDLDILIKTANFYANDIKENYCILKDELDKEYAKDFKQDSIYLEKKYKDELSLNNIEYQRKYSLLYNNSTRILEKKFPDEIIQDLNDKLNNNIFLSNQCDYSNDIMQSFNVKFNISEFTSNEKLASILYNKFKDIINDNSIVLPMSLSLSIASSLIMFFSSESTNVQADLLNLLIYELMSKSFSCELKIDEIRIGEDGNIPDVFKILRQEVPDLFSQSFMISTDSSLMKVLDEIKDSKFIHGKNKNLNRNILIIYIDTKQISQKSIDLIYNFIEANNNTSLLTFIVSHDREDFENDVSMEQLLSKSYVIYSKENKSFYSLLPIQVSDIYRNYNIDDFLLRYKLAIELNKPYKNNVCGLIDRILRANNDIDNILSSIEKSNNSIGMTNFSRISSNCTYNDKINLSYVLVPESIFFLSKKYGDIKNRSSIYDINNKYIKIPLEFNLNKNFNIYLYSQDQYNKNNLDLIDYIIFTILTNIPVTKLNICIFDCIGRGNNINRFLNFRKNVEDIFDRKIFTNNDEIQGRLIEFNNEIDETIQDKLGNSYDNIIQYNKDNQRQSKGITLLVIYNLEESLSGLNIELLSSVISNGNKCGIYTVILDSKIHDYVGDRQFSNAINSIKRNSNIIEADGDQFYLKPYNLKLSFNKDLINIDMDKLSCEYLEISKKIENSSIAADDVISDKLYSRTSSKALSIPIGMGESDSIIELVLGKGSSHHCLIAGATGSGKSTLLHTIIMNGMLNYSPEQLNLYLMDFKSGTEFKIYENYRLPHIKLLGLDALQEFGESILEDLVNEMNVRAKLFKDNGASKILEYTEITGNSMPRILVIMDEFQILFNDSNNRKIAMNCAELAKRIVTEGRAFGIHLIMATQSTKVIGDLTLSNGIIEQMRVRIGLKCAESDVRYLFNEDESKIISMMRGPIGTAVINSDFIDEDSVGFRTSYFDDDSQKKYLEQISNSFNKLDCSTLVFEGSRTRNLYEFISENTIQSNSSNDIKIYVGDLIKVAPPLVITVDRKRKNNILICGSDVKMQDRLSFNFIISMLLNTLLEVNIIDGNFIIGDDHNNKLYSELEEYSDRLNIIKDRPGIISYINELYEEYLNRKKNGEFKNIFVLIRDIQYIDIIMSMLSGKNVDESEYIEKDIKINIDEDNPFSFESEFYSEEMNISEKLNYLIKNGSAYGIFFMITSLDYNTIKDTMYYNDNILATFTNRFVFSLGNYDANNLIEDISLEGMDENMVYYSDTIKNTLKVKPFTEIKQEGIKSILNA